MILDKTLEDCGLIQGQQYFLQENYKDKDGNNFRPDAVIVFPNEERAVIDAKVSLTAYQAAIREEDATERERYLKEHVPQSRSMSTNCRLRITRNLYRAVSALY